MSPLLVFLGILVLVGLWLVAIYNGLVHLRNYVDNAWAQIDVQLKRRHDLIPNLIETVKGYMATSAARWSPSSSSVRMPFAPRDLRRLAKPKPRFPVPSAA